MLPGKGFIDKLTIKHVLLIGLAARLLAVFFSPGYAFHDDHFEMPELVFDWQQGRSFLWTGTNIHVFSLIYPGMMYLLFETCQAIGIRRPEDLMFVVRLVHALISLLSIYYAYLLTIRLTAKKDTAILVALAMALFWLFPFMSVRNLRESFCIPFLMMGSYYMADPKLSNRSIFLSALFFALSFCIRLQILFIPAGIGIALLFKKQYIKKAVLFGIAFGIAYFLTQGLFDYLYYKDPFASIKEYIRFNSDPANIGLQPQGPWYQYIGTVAGVVWGLPFFLLAWGYIYSFRLSFPIRTFCFASLLFFAFHSYYSNKQERFILPFLPFFLLLGIIGLKEYYGSRAIAPWLRKVSVFLFYWFLIFNTAGLLVLSFTYSKRSRVEAMIYLRKKGDVTNIILEGDAAGIRPPLFYMNKHVDRYNLPADKTIEQLKAEINTSGYAAPNYVIMAGNPDFDARVNRLKTLFPDIRRETVATSSFVDNLAYWLNPKHNQNEDWYIYKLK